MTAFVHKIASPGICGSVANRYGIDAVFTGSILPERLQRPDYAGIGIGADVDAGKRYGECVALAVACDSRANFHRHRGRGDLRCRNGVDAGLGEPFICNRTVDRGSGVDIYA